MRMGEKKQTRKAFTSRKSFRAYTGLKRLKSATEAETTTVTLSTWCMMWMKVQRRSEEEVWTASILTVRNVYSQRTARLKCYPTSLSCDIAVRTRDRPVLWKCAGFEQPGDRKELINPTFINKAKCLPEELAAFEPTATFCHVTQQIRLDWITHEKSGKKWIRENHRNISNELAC